MNRLALCLALAAAAATGMILGCQGGGNPTAQPAAPPSTGPFKDDTEKTLYALGITVGRNVAVFNLTPSELEIVKRGLTDQITGQKPAVEIDVYGPKIQELARSRSEATAAKEKEKGKAFADAAAKEPGATALPSGLVIKTMTPGTGATPKATDVVKVHYHGTLMDGTVFDSSVKRGQPAEFPLNGVIPCWTEGVQKMKVGEKARLVCPAAIAYGDRGHPPTIPGGATLIFEVELLEIKAPGAPPAPMMPPPSPPKPAK